MIKMNKQKLKDIIVRGEKERSILKKNYNNIMAKFLTDQWKKENDYLVIKRKGGHGIDIEEAIVRREFCILLRNRFRVWLSKNHKNNTIEIFPFKAEQQIEKRQQKDMIQKIKRWHEIQHNITLWLDDFSDTPVLDIAVACLGRGEVEKRLKKQE